MSSNPQNLTERHAWPSQDAFLAAHGRICDEFGRLEQLRSSLLTSIPGITALLSGASIFIGVTHSVPQLTHFISVLGVLGMFTCLGLYYREVEYEIEKISLEDQLTTYEKDLKIPNTLYTPTPGSPHKLLKKEHSAILLYSSSFTAWYCVATWFILPDFPDTQLSWALILVPFVMLGIVFAMWEIRHTRITSSPCTGSNQLMSARCPSRRDGGWVGALAPSWYLKRAYSGYIGICTILMPNLRRLSSS